MSKKSELFMAALKELCTKHRVSICTSGYDLIELWDWDTLDDKFIDCGGEVEDHTTEDPAVDTRAQNNFVEAHRLLTLEPVYVFYGKDYIERDRVLLIMAELSHAAAAKKEKNGG